MASLEAPSAPLPLYIAKDLADLKSLHALRLSSSTFTAVFNLHAAELFEHLAAKNLSEEMLIELRAYTLLLNQPQTDPGLELLYSAAKDSLPRNTSPSAIGHTLHSLAVSSTTCISVFSRKLERLYSLPSSAHQHLAERSGHNQAYYRLEAVTLQPGRMYNLPAPIPLEWDEQQRLLFFVRCGE